MEALLPTMVCTGFLLFGIFLGAFLMRWRKNRTIRRLENTLRESIPQLRKNRSRKI